MEGGVGAQEAGEQGRCGAPVVHAGPGSKEARSGRQLLSALLPGVRLNFGTEFTADNP